MTCDLIFPNTSILRQWWRPKPLVTHEYTKVRKRSSKSIYLKVVYAASNPSLSIWKKKQEKCVRSRPARATYRDPVSKEKELSRAGVWLGRGHLSSMYEAPISIPSKHIQTHLGSHKIYICAKISGALPVEILPSSTLGTQQLSLYGKTGEQAATCICWLKTRDGAKHPAEHRTAPTFPEQTIHCQWTNFSFSVIAHPHFMEPRTSNMLDKFLNNKQSSLQLPGIISKAYMGKDLPCGLHIGKVKPQ